MAALQRTQTSHDKTVRRGHAVPLHGASALLGDSATRQVREGPGAQRGLPASGAPLPQDLTLSLPVLVTAFSRVQGGEQAHCPDAFGQFWPLPKPKAARLGPGSAPPGGGQGWLAQAISPKTGLS